MKSVLIADSDPQRRLRLASQLRQRQWDVRVAIDGIDLEAQASTARPDVLVASTQLRGRGLVECLVRLGLTDGSVPALLLHDAGVLPGARSMVYTRRQAGPQASASELVNHVESMAADVLAREAA